MKALAYRVLGGVSRRLDRPELMSAFYGHVRQAEHEEIGIEAALVASLAADAVYVDVGSNRGQVLAHAVRIAPRGRHVAFEPIPALADELAGRFPTVDRRAKALGESAGKATFCHFQELDGWSGLRRNPEISDARGKPEYIEVEVSTLDIEMSALEPAVVKIDVEGAELEVLRGGRETLARVRPLLILEHVPSTAAVYGTSSAELWELLGESGYEVFTATGSGPVGADRLAEHAHVVNWIARPR
ncbi:MAG TPA: FkbM family methyltransferase [Solirubrobacteraceae bacterium]|jgi:FkbM family methyltransferase